LTVCFVLIILAMLVGDAVLLWQFHRVRAQADRLSGVDQEFIAVLQVHTSLMSFCQRLDELAKSQDTAALLREAEPLRKSLLEDTQHSRNVLSRLAPDVQLDPTLPPTLEAIQSALPEQLEAITALAKSRDWEAVRLHVANQIRPVESQASALVQNVDREVSIARSQAVLKIEQARRRILLIVPITAALTLLIAAFLGWAIRHSITEPLGRLMEGSKALARGEFQHRVAIGGEDELARLGRVFNDTAERLRDLYATLQQDEREVRQLIDVIPQHLVVMEPDGSIVYVNQVAREYTGLTLGRQRGGGRSCEALSSG
jgi:nitrate/nitrite-specific signal transduction histidine kinase